MSLQLRTERPAWALGLNLRAPRPSASSREEGIKDGGGFSYRPNHVWFFLPSQLDQPVLSGVDLLKPANEC